MAVEKGASADFPVNSSGAKAVSIAGKALGWYDAAKAVNAAYENPTVGNVAKAAVKTTLAALETFVKVNPYVGAVTALLDVTGFTDWLFASFDKK